MKILLKIALLAGIGCSVSACSEKEATPKDDTTACTHTATIIGLAPCGDQGYIIALEAPRDTVVTYNLPKGLINYVPGVTPVSGKGDGLFAPAAFVRIKTGYSVLADNERTPILCLATVYTLPFNRMTKGKEVRLLCADKATY